jgi:hypothetical protein
MTVRYAAIFTMTLCAGVLGACDKRDEPRVDISPSRPADPDRKVAVARMNNQQAIAMIADTRCAREQRCENIGADKKFASMAVCKTELRDAKRDDLKLSECPGGIDQKELSECMTEIRNEDCSNPLEALERVMACRSSDLCIKTR